MEFVKKHPDIKIQVKNSEAESSPVKRERRMASLIHLNNIFSPSKQNSPDYESTNIVNIEKLIIRNILDKDSKADKHLKIFKLTQTYLQQIFDKLESPDFIEKV